MFKFFTKRWVNRKTTDLLEKGKLYKLGGAYHEHLLYFDSYVKVDNTTWAKTFCVTQWYKNEKNKDAIEKAKKGFYLESKKFVYEISLESYYVNLNKMEDIQEVDLEQGT